MPKATPGFALALKFHAVEALTQRRMTCYNNLIRRFFYNFLGKANLRLFNQPMSTIFDFLNRKMNLREVKTKSH